jgi:exopolysaccharide biosynthesis polyprenyl glycosylphosphotransferase
MADRLAQYDVRLRREITHRRLAVSMFRRLLRVLSLHVLDAAILASVVLWLSRLLPGAADVRPLTPAIVAIFLLSLESLSAYRPGDARRDWRRLVSGVGLGLLILLCLATFPPKIPVTPSFLLTLGAAAVAALYVERKLIDQLVRQAYVRGFGLRRALMVGSLDEVGCAIQQLRDDRNIDQYIVGHLAPDEEADPTALGSLSTLAEVVREHDIQEVILATSLATPAVSEIADCCFERGVALFIIPSVMGSLNCRAEPLRVGSCTLLRLHPARLEFPALLVKGLFDVMVAALALVVLSPLIALIALAIKLDSPGPVFFSHKRVGLGGRLFTMWKFRSMYVDAEAREKELAHLNIYKGGTFKIRNDPRVTRMGRFLRRTSLDELPQLFNVLRGDMSLVGPRPALVADLERYEPHHYERLTVVPGMTGPWQVGGRNLVTDFERILEMERTYIRNWSLVLDAKILLRTVRVVVRGDGAY